VALFLLDEFRLFVDGQHVTPSMCAQRLLAYLALTGGRLRSVVACALWPDVLDAQALASLRTAIWRVDRCANGIVNRGGSSIALAGFVTVDVAELVEHASQLLGSAASNPGSHRSDAVRARPELVVECGGRSELLPGWHDDWVECERERLRQLRLHALEAASSRMLRLGQFSLALEAALEAVRSEPLRETAHRAVIEVHLAEGNAAEAVNAFRRYRSLLRDDLGLEPSERLVAWLNAQLSHARRDDSGSSRSRSTPLLGRSGLAPGGWHEATGNLTMN
jgi:DNA-binding SARP family transcriptional activator